jgi:hypothetical protein
MIGSMFESICLQVSNLFVQPEDQECVRGVVQEQCQKNAEEQTNVPAYLTNLGLSRIYEVDSTGYLKLSTVAISILYDDACLDAQSLAIW